MAFKINGFGPAQEEKKNTQAAYEAQTSIAPRKSLVQIRFPGKGMALSYYNDQFDLHPGDRVYVDGKLEEATANILKKFPKEAGNFQKEDICLKPFSQSKASPTF